MELIIHRSGVLTSVQDPGRPGHRAAGVPLSGAMDPFALCVANLLVGNDEGAAALEFTLVGPELEFSGDVLMAVTGADCEGARSWRPIAMRAGERLKLGHCVRGCRGYLAVAGGIDVDPVLGSRSTYLRGGFGGFEGRALRDGDQLRVLRSASRPSLVSSARAWEIDARILPLYSASATARVIRAPGSEAGTEWLLEAKFKVSAHSDRMGLRLMAGNLPQRAASDLLSTAVVPGTVQIPPDGQPVVLMADAQTIGGYRQAAHVIGVDLPIVAQLRPGDELGFVEVSINEAHRLALARHRAVAMLREGLAEKLGGASVPSRL